MLQLFHLKIQINLQPKYSPLKTRQVLNILRNFDRFIKAKQFDLTDKLTKNLS